MHLLQNLARSGVFPAVLASVLLGSIYLSINFESFGCTSSLRVWLNSVVNPSGLGTSLVTGFYYCFNIFICYWFWLLISFWSNTGGFDESRNLSIL